MNERRVEGEAGVVNFETASVIGVFFFHNVSIGRKGGISGYNISSVVVVRGRLLTNRSRRKFATRNESTTLKVGHRIE